MDLDSIKWRYTQVGSWTCGFWPGILWYLYEDTKDNMWREAAGQVTDMIAPLAYRKAKSHDSGFIMMCSLGNGYIRKDCCMPQILWLCFIILLWVLFYLGLEW